MVIRDPVSQEDYGAFCFLIIDVAQIKKCIVKESI